jgi:hypothetical protein
MEGNPINIKASGLSSPSQKIVVFSSRLMPDGRFKGYQSCQSFCRFGTRHDASFRKAAWPVPEIGVAWSKLAAAKEQQAALHALVPILKRAVARNGDAIEDER